MRDTDRLRVGIYAADDPDAERSKVHRSSDQHGRNRHLRVGAQSRAQLFEAACGVDRLCGGVWTWRALGGMDRGEDCIGLRHGEGDLQPDGRKPGECVKR
ncbi:hypothetical protein D1872_314040 [compost metagenome]